VLAEAWLRGYDRPVLRVSVSAASSASPEQVLRAARDFSEQRSKVWANVKSGHLDVHESGADFAEVTERLAVFGRFWERSRYEWPHPGSVKQTVLDSNVLEPASTRELRAVSGDRGGSQVEMVLARSFRRGASGRIASALNHLGGKRAWGSYLRRALATIENQSDAEPSVVDH
jgi:hypothetical protein